MDFKGLQKQLGRLAVNTNRAAVEAARKTAKWALREAQSRTKQTGAVASKEFLGEWDMDHMPDGAVVYNGSPYAYYVEIGRRPGRPPPIGAIARWLIKKKLVKLPKVRSSLTAKGQAKAHKARAKRYAIARSMAYVIARAIGRRGIKGKFILASVVRDLGPIMSINLNMAMHKATMRQEGVSSKPRSSGED